MTEYEFYKRQAEEMKAKQGLRWIVIATEGLPPEDGYYLATVGSAGIDPADATTHELNWFKGKWYLPSDEMVEMGPVVAWRLMPKPYIAEEPCPICGGIEGCDHTLPERQRAAGSK